MLDIFKDEREKLELALLEAKLSLIDSDGKFDDLFATTKQMSCRLDKCQKDFSTLMIAFNQLSHDHNNLLQMVESLHRSKRSEVIWKQTR